jgi:hypothetical protein
MERAEWPDVRLDERMAAIEHTFERIDHSMRDLGDEIRAVRGDLGDEIRAVRSDLGDEMRAMRSDLTAEVRAIHHRLTQIGYGLAGILAAGLITLVATQL